MAAKYGLQVLFLATGTRLKDYQVHGHEIADLEVVPTNSAPQLLPESQSVKALQKPHSTLTVVRTSTAEQNGFTDPAILSYARTPSKGYAAGQLTSEVSNLPSEKGQEIFAETVKIVDRVHTEIFATLTTPFSPLGVGSGAENFDEGNGDPEAEPELRASGNLSSTELAATKNQAGSRGGKEQKQKQRDGTSKNPEPRSSPEVIPNENVRPNGWRRTPILKQDIEQPPTRLPPKPAGFVDGDTGQHAAISSGRKTRRTRRRPAVHIEAVNGWATEDATDVQELGDFDFVGNLSKFDKIAVFDQLRSEDTTADEDRLVSFNRVTIPGTFGGRKLHHSENVLEHPIPNIRDLKMSESEDEDLVDSVSLPKVKRTLSRTSVRQVPFRKGSSVLSESGNMPTPLIQLNKFNRSLGHVKYVSSRSTTSPTIHGVTSPTLASNSFSASSRSHLRYLDSNIVCPTTTPEKLRKAELLSDEHFSLSEDILAENAARGIAEIALSAINSGGGRRDSGIHNVQPMIIVLIDNNVAGARALAAARHLHERGVHVIVSALGYCNIEDIIHGQKQYLVLQAARFSGSYMQWETLSEFLKTLNAPPELIIDAVLGIHCNFSGLDAEDKLDAMEMVGWANKSSASVLAVDIPSGVDGVTGEVEIRDGEPAEIRAKIVVCCGMPTLGLRRAMELRQEEGENWRVFVCDTGINQARRQMSKTDSGRSKWVNFGSGWLVELYLSAGDG